MRNGQQAALALDAIALAGRARDPDGRSSAASTGAPGRRTSWPRSGRSAASGARVGQRLSDRQPGGQPAAVAAGAELAWWYQFYFATERGRAGYAANTARLRQAHLADRLAALGVRRRDVRAQRRGPRQPGSRRHRHPQLPLADRRRGRRGAVRRDRGAAGRRPDDRRADDHPRRRRERRARTRMPAAYRAKFTGPYAHRLITGGVGHNLPQEAPRAFADAIIEVDGY